MPFQFFTLFQERHYFSFMHDLMFSASKKLKLEFVNTQKSAGAKWGQYDRLSLMEMPFPANNCAALNQEICQCIVVLKNQWVPSAQLSLLVPHGTNNFINTSTQNVWLTVVPFVHLNKGAFCILLSLTCSLHSLKHLCHQKKTWLLVTVVSS